MPVFVEKNLIRVEIPTSKSVIYTATVKIALKHLIMTNSSSDDDALVSLDIGPNGSELPFFSKIRVQDDGFFQWDGWEVLNIGDRIVMKSNRKKVYIHIAGAEL